MLVWRKFSSVRPHMLALPLQVLAQVPPSLRNRPWLLRLSFHRPCPSNPSLGITGFISHYSLKLTYSFTGLLVYYLSLCITVHRKDCGDTRVSSAVVSSAPRTVADTDRVLLSDLLVSIRKDLFYSFTLSHIYVVGIY